MSVLPDNNTISYNQILEDEYQNLKNIVFKYDTAISEVLTGGHASYSLDSGQTKQDVTRHNLATLQNSRNVAAARMNDLAIRLRKTSAVKQIRMGW